MRLLRHSVVGIFLVFSMTFPLGAFAAGSIFDPIIPEDCKCKQVGVANSTAGQISASAPSWGCVLKVVQNVINTAVGIAIVIIVLAIIYAGFVFMTSGANPGAREQGRNVVTNSVLGLLIILGAWLGVDFVMKAVYDPTKVISGETRLGPWNAIWAGDSAAACLVVRNPEPITTGTISILTNPSSAGGAGGGVAGIGFATGACAPEALASTWGSLQRAQLFSCIINNESKCQNIQTSAPSTVAGVGSSAGGRYQIVMSTNGLNFPSCIAAARAAGYQVGNQLNCNQHYPRGRSDGTPAAAACRAAQLNVACNTEAAKYLYDHGGVSHWLGQGDVGGKNAACVARYGR